MLPRAEQLERVLNPKSIAFVGASNDPEKWGYIVLANMLNGKFGGQVYPVNPREKEILGLPVCASIADIPSVPDLAVITVPAPAIPQVIQDCLQKGIRGGLVITAGLGEAGEQGAQIENEMVQLARQGGMVLVGPNGNGVMSPHSSFYCAMAKMYPAPGSFAIISQSGNIAQSFATGIMARGLGVSHYISSGNEADLNMADYIEYLNHDDSTQVILSYVEGFREGRKFFEAARTTTKRKPIVLLKAGNTSTGAQAARSHTASLATSDSIVEAVCRQAGITRVRNLDEMVDIGSVFVNQPLPRGNRVAILTAGGGYGVVVADALVEAGLEVAKLSEETLTKLDKYLPPRWPRSNPVDRSGRSSLGEAVNILLLEILMASPEVDGVITLGVPIGGAGSTIEQRMEHFSTYFKQAVQLRDQHQKPIIAVPTWSLVQPETITKLKGLTQETQTAVYATPNSAVAAYIALAKYARYLRMHTG